MKTALLLLLGCVLLVSCAPPPPDVAAVRKTIEAMTAKSAKDMMAGVFDTTLANYTDDAVSMPNNEPLQKGKPAIKAYYQQMMGMGMKFSKVDFVTIDVQVGLPYAYEVGTYTMTMEMAGMPSMDGPGQVPHSIRAWQGRQVADQGRDLEHQQAAADARAAEDARTGQEKEEVEQVTDRRIEGARLRSQHDSDFLDGLPDGERSSEDHHISARGDNPIGGKIGFVLDAQRANRPVLRDADRDGDGCPVG